MRQIWARTTPETARPTRSSISRPPDWRWILDVLVDVVLNSISGYETCESARVVDMGPLTEGLPGEDDGHHAQVRSIGVGDRGLADDDAAVVGDTFAPFGGRVSGGEVGRDKAGCI